MQTFGSIDKKIKNGIYLYGACANGIWVQDFCRENNINVIGFIDSDKNKQGRDYNGIPCISYEDYSKKHDDKVILVTTKHYVNEVMSQYGSDPNIYPFDAWIAQKYEKEYKKLRFEDNRSYDTLNAMLLCMLTCKVEELQKVAEGKQYFCTSPFWGIINETFVDLGAYTGETTEQFINAVGGSFRKIYAFEPSEKQYLAMQKRKKRLCEEWALDTEQIVLEKACAGNADGFLYFDTSTVSKNDRISETGTEKVRVVALDYYFRDKDITFLKADIEGAELGMLKGSEQLIRRCRPKMAICVYHRPDDLLKIYHYIDGLDLGYKFKLRHHSCEVT